MRKLRLTISLSLLCLLCPVLHAAANTGMALETSAREAVLIDYETGEVLYEKNADIPAVPSSMTKLMTVYLLFDHLKKGVLTPDSTFRVSEKAWRMGGSKMFVSVNSDVTMDDLLKGIIIQSGNDACVVAAEGIAGSEDAFAGLMNQKAQELGLRNSHFMNATGWPAEGHHMSMKDIAVLSYHLIRDFPEYYAAYFPLKEFTYHHIRQHNRNQLLQHYSYIDGLKTGHTEEGGYGIAISGTAEDGRRQIVVVNGLASDAERTAEAQKLFTYGARYFAVKAPLAQGQVVENAKIRFGEEKTVPAIAASDIAFVYPKLEEESVTTAIAYDTAALEAPIKKGTKIGTYTVTIPGIGTRSFDLLAGHNVEALGWFGRQYEIVKEKAGW